MNVYKIIFHMTNGQTRETVLRTGSLEAAEELLLANGRPFKTFYSEIDKERKSFSINIYNVNAIDYVLVDESDLRDENIDSDFIDLVSSLDSFTIERVLGQIYDNTLIARALRGATDQVKVLVLLNVSDKRKILLDNEDQGLGDVRDSDIEDARRCIVNVITGLAASGEIVLPL